MRDTVFVVHCERISRRQAYKVWFPYNEQLINIIRELPHDSRKWHSFEKTWELTTSALYTLIKRFKGSKKIYFDFGNPDSRKVFINQVEKLKAKEREKRELLADLEKKKKQWVKWKQELEENYLEYWDRVHENLKEGVKLYPHQVVAAMYLNVVRNALLALDMGTGKSLISIAYVEMNDFQKVLVITPNSLKYNYMNEVLKFTKSNGYIIGKKNKCCIEDAKYIIVNYEYFNSSSFTKVMQKYKKLNIGKIDCFIADESHRLKSTSSNTYKNIRRIINTFMDKNGSKIFMSGTPAPSKAMELYSVLHEISPIDFPNKKYFYEYYCGMTYNLEGYDWETNINNTKFEELFHKISPFTYRKKKSEVLKDLPEKKYQKILLEMTPKEYEIYNDLEEGVANEFTDQTLSNPLSIMGKLREYTSHLKVNSVKELIDTILQSGEKFVAIDFFKESLVKLHQKYPEISALHTGDEKDFVRADVIKDFQNENGKIKIFLGSEMTTKEGLTLTEANKMGVMTIPWTPGALDQVSDRLCRIGQKNAVNVYLFIYKDTIDEYVFNLIESKKAEISQVIDGVKYESNVNQSIINDLIKIIKEKHKKIDEK